MPGMLIRSLIVLYEIAEANLLSISIPKIESWPDLRSDTLDLGEKKRAERYMPGPQNQSIQDPWLK